MKWNRFINKRNVKKKRREKKAPTVAIQHNQACHHQHRMPVELQRRPVPGKTAPPPAVPQTHAHHAGQTEAQAQQVAHVEAHDGRHSAEVWRLNQWEELNIRTDCGWQDDEGRSHSRCVSFQENKTKTVKLTASVPHRSCENILNIA